MWVQIDKATRKTRGFPKLHVRYFVCCAHPVLTHSLRFELCCISMEKLSRLFHLKNLSYSSLAKRSLQNKINCQNYGNSSNLKWPPPLPKLGTRWSWELSRIKWPPPHRRKVGNILIFCKRKFYVLKGWKWILVYLV